MQYYPSNQGKYNSVFVIFANNKQINWTQAFFDQNEMIWNWNELKFWAL
jgi:hypothetical protein